MDAQNGAKMRFVRRDCINACEGLLKKVDEELPFVSIGMEGLYYRSRNTFKDSTAKEKRSKGDRGNSLVIEFAGEDRPLTAYAMTLKDLNAKSKTRSLRFDGQPGAPGVTATVSRLGGVEELGSIGDRLFRSTSLAANSMSFGPMLETASPDGSGKTASWLEDGLSPDSSEHKAAAAMLDLGLKGEWDQVLDAARAGDDPIKAMAAWSVVAYKLEGRLDQGAGGMDPNDPRLAELAGQAMGLEALYDGLRTVNDRMAMDPDYIPDLNEVMDPDDPKGRAALRGLMCLSMYKEIKDRGGKDMKDDAGVPVIAIDSAHASVYDRLVFARADAEALSRSYEALEQRRSGFARAACVQSTFAGIEPDGPQSPRAEIRKFDQYRFYRSAMLGERPDMPSKAPDMTLSVRPGCDTKRLSAENIMVAASGLPEGTPRMSLRDFLESAASGNEACRAVTDQMPAMARELRLRNGVDRLCQSAAEILKKTGGADMDGMILEMSAFMGTAEMNKANFENCMKEAGRDGRSANDLQKEFEANFCRNYAKAPQLMREINRSVGMPDFDFGQLKVGSMWLADIKRNTPYLENMPTAESIGGGNRIEAKAALAFRRRDKEMRAVLHTAEECSTEEIRDMQSASAAMPEGFAAGEFTRQLGRYLQIQNGGPEDLEKGAMMLNDFLVLSSTYNITSRKGLSDLARDIDAAYSPDAGKEKLLYRPVDRAEKNALSAIYASTRGELGPAKVEFRSQKNPIGFLTAAWNGLSAGAVADPEGAGKADALKILQTAALDQDTFADRKYGDLAGRLAGPPKGESAMHMMAKAGQSMEHPAPDPNRQVGS